MKLNLKISYGNYFQIFYGKYFHRYRYVAIAKEETRFAYSKIYSLSVLDIWGPSYSLWSTDSLFSSRSFNIDKYLRLNYSTYMWYLNQRVSNSFPHTYEKSIKDPSKHENEKKKCWKGKATLEFQFQAILTANTNVGTS